MVAKLGGRHGRPFPQENRGRTRAERRNIGILGRFRARRFNARHGSRSDGFVQEQVRPQVRCKPRGKEPTQAWRHRRGDGWSPTRHQRERVLRQEPPPAGLRQSAQG
ncbi:MAG: hypothetical protein EBR71_00350, partial [Planctomycetes bacterium]|nr:hypothetical protein [Planctomycetota bacterium]